MSGGALCPLSLLARFPRVLLATVHRESSLCLHSLPLEVLRYALGHSCGLGLLNLTGTWVFLLFFQHLLHLPLRGHWDF